jgi:hypothetical protein
MLTKTPLQANMSYIQAGRDRFESGIPAGSVSGLVWADKAGTLYLEESDDDGVTWSQTTNVSVSASTTTVLPWTALTKQQYRFRYVNGAAAQTKFRLVQQTRGMELTTVDLSPLENRIDAITSGDTPATAQLTGSKMELYGASLDDRPDATTVPIGTTFTIVDDTGNFDSYISDGTNWMEV